LSESFYELYYSTYPWQILQTDAWWLQANFNILLFRNSTKHNRINRRLNNENIHLNALKPFVNRYLSCWLLSISSRWVNNRLVFSYHKIIIKITQCYLDFYISWWIIWVCQGLYSSQVLMDYGGIHNCSGNKF